MDYEKVYKDLVNSRKDRVLDENEYYENHHIVPKCLKGSNNKENLIYLTAKEHFLAHHLLYKCAKNTNEKVKLAKALCFLIYGNKKQSKKKITAKQYEISRKILAKEAAIRKYAKGKHLGPLSISHKKSISKTMKGKCKTEQHKINISNGMKGKKYTNERKENIAKAILGKTLCINIETLERKYFNKEEIPINWQKYKRKNRKKEE